MFVIHTKNKNITFQNIGQNNLKTKMKKKNKLIKNTITWLSVFAIVFAFLETTIVIYLRRLYYPQGFDFPLVNIPPEILNIEWLREISAIIIIISIAIIAGKDFYQKFAYFLYIFGIWDIFYYIWLKIIASWPVSFLTWDLLFLVPVPWISPTLAPLICSLTMIILALLLFCFPKKKINPSEWLLLLGGAFIIFLSFIWEYLKLIIQNSAISQFIPIHFNWILFTIGEILILFMLILFIKKDNT